MRINWAQGADKAMLQGWGDIGGVQVPQGGVLSPAGERREV